MWRTCVLFLIRNPTTEHWINKIEDIQNQFLRFMALKTNTPTTSIITPITTHGFDSLAKPQLFNDISFIHKSFNDDVDCPEILSWINFNFPSRFIRNPSTFKIDHHRQNCSQNTLINRMLSSCNFIINYDFHFDSLSSLHSKIQTFSY